MSDKFYKPRRAFIAVAFSLALITSAATALARQAGNAGAQNTGGETKPEQTTTDAKPWSVKMSRATPATFTVKAKDARLSEITNEISRMLKVPISVSPLMAKQRITLDFGGLNLEATLRMLAPQSYIDYVAGGKDAQPRPLAIYLLGQGPDERAPATTAAVHGNSEAILIEGDTEEGTDNDAQKKKEEEDPLRVTFVNNQLSVRAHKQPLSVVLYKIASEVGVPFEMRYESPEVIDVDFSNYSLDQALRSISPEVRFYYRLDLQTFQIQPLRLALVAPSAPKS